VAIETGYPANFSRPFQESPLPQRLHETYSRIEKERGAVVPLIVRNFIEIAITETYYLNRPTDPDTCLSSVLNILGGAQEVSYEGTKYVSLIGVVEQVHLQWCRIPPFCR
jgi:hypothetical protein